MRLDKYLANMGVGTRSEVKGYIKQRRVQVNGEYPKGPEQKIHEENDCICLDGKRINFVSMEYIMLHKPQGCITATEDKHEKTVMDLINSPIKKYMFPVG
ncbi:MAG: rRNA pseudouridine synthase, partial [Lachnospiraceae bacterium]|nr:rRNA pseudouridine synthase [Lachnospiraceae bacterium]